MTWAWSEMNRQEVSRPKGSRLVNKTSGVLQESLSQIPTVACTLIAMHRVSATLLIVLFGLSLIGPAVSASDEESKLPACCRRGGQHHCAMQAGKSESSSSPALNTARCSRFPLPSSVPANRIVTLVGTIRPVFAGFVSRAAYRPQVRSICRISYSCACQKRGPPSPIS